MARHRRFLFVSLVALMIGFGVGTRALWPRPSAITEENFLKIEAGMSVQEVEFHLGGPAHSVTQADVMLERPATAMRWVGPVRTIEVCFLDGQVYLQDCEWTPLQESLLDRILRWLGL